MGLHTICTCYYRTINVLQQGRATVYQLQGLEASMEPIPLGGITEATGSGEEGGEGRDRPAPGYKSIPSMQ